jgi:hypothetical protein
MENKAEERRRLKRSTIADAFATTKVIELDLLLARLHLSANDKGMASTFLVPTHTDNT